MDAVLAAFALHHIRNLNEKTGVYRRVREAIRSEGVFLNADAVSGPSSGRRYEMEWAAFMAGKGFTLEQAYQNLEDWAGKICISLCTKPKPNDMLFVALLIRAARNAVTGAMDFHNSNSLVWSKY